ncbi:hypothetical protein QEG98_16150 [Myxococcus sp. MxC21-1]|nr:hypothetical protein QEG98_16150 [Myxococcus sp. MxC21-1]
MMPRAEQVLEHARAVRAGEDVAALGRACELLTGCLAQLKGPAPGGTGR